MLLLQDVEQLMVVVSSVLKFTKAMVARALPWQQAAAQKLHALCAQLYSDTAAFAKLAIPGGADSPKSPPKSPWPTYGRLRRCTPAVITP